jgi:hypothetical protein
MHEVQNVYYGRDREEKGCGYKVYKDEAEYLKSGWNSGEQYLYLFKDVGSKDYLGKPVGTWFYAESRYTSEGKEVVDETFKELEEAAIKDHIEILNRHLEQKNRMVA